MTRVLLNVSSPALRAGLRALLSSDETIEVVNDSLVEESEADVVIASASHVSFSDTSLSATEGDFSVSAATLFISDDPLSIRTLRRSLRVWGILPTDASGEELIAAVHALSQGLIVGTTTLLFESETDSEPLSNGPLTDRESQVLGLLAKGMANKQIAVALGISEHTVKFHVSSIYAKLSVTNRTEAVREGLRGGWIAL
ncbi:MAG TPA: response regulator transcription factor [Anaerolineales bacterium]|nr:response regulator transcription factor [Anaerolineales bacterium]